MTFNIFLSDRGFLANLPKQESCDILIFEVLFMAWQGN